MNIAKTVLITLLGVILVLAATFSVDSLASRISQAEAVDKTDAGSEGASEHRGIKDLPCFKCHIYDDFLREPSPGVFSHALHVQFEYHCNQCHSFSGHRQMSINAKVCTICHDDVPELKKP